MLSSVSPHILVPFLPFGTAPSTLVLEQAPTPRKYFQRFFDMEVDPRAGRKPPQNHPAFNLRRIGIREAAEEKPRNSGQGSIPGPQGHHASGV